MKIKNLSNNDYLWDKPKQRYFLFLERVKKYGLPPTICILGASDGNYVIPATNKGFKVTAFEVDPIALYGGTILRGDKKFTTIGLVGHTRQNNIQDLVNIIPEDFISYKKNETFSAVFTSGSIHYQDNSKYNLDEIIHRIQKYVSPGGLLLLEYIHTSKENCDPNRHFVTTNQIASLFEESEWLVTSNKRKTYIELPNPRNGNVHRLVWGRLYARKK